MTIILGVFGNSFGKLMYEHDAIEYYADGWIKTSETITENRPFFSYKIKRQHTECHPNNPFNSEIVDEVCYNLDACDSCVFDVTHLKLPFNETVITLKELHVVIHNQEYFDKTTFFVNSKQINKHKLKELFLLNEPIEFQDYDELFNL